MSGTRYWFGTPNKDGRNLATCVWRNQRDARIGSVGEAHRRAAGATRFLYGPTALSFHTLQSFLFLLVPPFTLDFFPRSRNHTFLEIAFIGEMLTSRFYRYTEWQIERLKLLVKDDAADFEITQWVD